MIDGPFRKILPRFSKPLIAVYSRRHLSPNHITVAGFLLAVAAAGSVAMGYLLLALPLWWLGRWLDGTDGIYARATGQVSPFGGFLDIFLDMAAYGLMILGFAVHAPELWPYWVTIEFLYMLCITGALALGAMERDLQLGADDNRSLRLASGLAEGGETGIAYSLFLLFPNALQTLASVWIFILLLTVIARTFLAMRMLKPGARPMVDTAGNSRSHRL